MKILIVDDDPFSRIVLMNLLKEYGTCHEADSAASAISMFESGLTDKAPYELVCLDIHLPDGSGQDVLLKLRNFEKECHVGKCQIFMVTGCSSPEEMQHAFFDGDCDDYLVKPVSKQAVVKLLEQHKLINIKDI